MLSIITSESFLLSFAKLFLVNTPSKTLHPAITPTATTPACFHRRRGPGDKYGLEEDLYK